MDSRRTLSKEGRALEDQVRGSLAVPEFIKKDMVRRIIGHAAYHTTLDIHLG
jgi:hypothetical protein